MRNVLYIIDYFKNIDPCSKDSSVCIVKAACHMRQEKPWIRSQKCPEYIKYTKRRDKFSTIKNESIDWFWTITMLSCFLFILFIFVLGIMKFIELIKWW